MILRSTRPFARLLPMPVVETGIVPRELAEGRLRGRPAGLAAADSAELPRVRVLKDVGVDGGADRKVTEFGRPGIDDLVRDVGTATRSADEVAFAQRIFRGPETQLPFAFENEEHLLVGVVIVERESALAGRNRGDVVSKLQRAERRADRRDPGLELVTVAQVSRELELIEIYHGSVHRSISPNTISCEPMIATISAIMCPRDISSSAARCGKPAARIFIR